MEESSKVEVINDKWINQFAATLYLVENPFAKVTSSDDDGVIDKSDAISKEDSHSHLITYPFSAVNHGSVATWKRK